MPKIKNLNITSNQRIEHELKIIKPHYDTVHIEFAEEHYGSYLIYSKAQGDTGQHSRLYLSYKKGIQFREALIQALKITGKQVSGSKNTRDGLINILDNYPEYNYFILDAMIKIVPENCVKSTIESDVWACAIFLEAMRINKCKLSKLSDITTNHQRITWDSLENIKHTKSNKAHLSTFFNHIAKLIEGFNSKKRQSRNIKKNILGLPTTVLYQIDYYCREDLDNIIYRSLEYNAWQQEFKSIQNLFSLENLAKTYYNSIDNGVNKEREKVRNLARLLYQVELRSFTRIRANPRRYEYKNEHQKKQHEMLLVLSKSGIDITINDERMLAFWIMEAFEGWPDNKVKKIYKNLLDIKSFQLVANRRFNIDFVLLRNRVLPTFHEIYPLILFILIREGLNMEVLRSWKVHKKENNEYEIGNNAGVATIIEGYKNRSKDIIWTPIKRDSITERYINFFLSWLTPLYEKNKSDSFFQYYQDSGKEFEIGYFKNRTQLRSAQQGRRWFFQRHTIILPKGERLMNIDHRQPRVNKQFDDYLKGLDEFERQRKRSHSNIDTQLHYDNIAERKSIQKHIIGKTLNLTEDIFRGKITRDDNPKVKIFEGIFADCTDPKNPDFYGNPKLHDDEVCTDWFMCLCMCTKSVVIPYIHGPVIFAWREYIWNEKEKFFRESDWEKEYLIQLNAANSVIEGFSNEEKKYSEEHMLEYEGIVNLHFKRKRKIY
ncbi:hypothetical protein [Sulfurospirillum arsenophilum]|uniref:hypothetical protein n=1 Tax=Sulfurospirillum arsenophilum TaxID=56698 RepID=UPI0005AB5F05|nr:hypothetical protein [Sulfurospirillum arsenophilum]